MSNRIRGFEPFVAARDGFVTARATEYGRAVPNIINIWLSDYAPQTGDTVDVEVQLENLDANDDGHQYDVFALMVDSPQLDTHITMYCAVIENDKEVFVDDSTSKDPGLDGEFPVTEPEMTIRARAMGMRKGRICSTGSFNRLYPNAAHTDEQTVSLTAEGATAAPPSFALSNLRVSDTPAVGERVQVSVDVENTGGEGSEAVTFGFADASGAFESSVTQRPTLAGGESTVAYANFTVPPGAASEWAQLRASVPASGAERTAPIAVRSQPLDEAIEVVDAGFEGAVDPVDGDSLTYTVRVRNTADVPWRVSTTLTDGTTGREVGGDVIDSLAPGATGTLASNVTLSAPQTEVCYALSGQSV